MKNMEADISTALQLWHIWNGGFGVHHQEILSIKNLISLIVVNFYAQICINYGVEMS